MSVAIVSAGPQSLCVYVDVCGCGCMAVECPIWKHLLLVRLLCGAENRTNQATPPRLLQTLVSSGG